MKPRILYIVLRFLILSLLINMISLVLLTGDLAAQEEFDLNGNWRLLIRGASSNCPENLQETGKYKLTERVLAIIEAESMPVNIIQALEPLIWVIYDSEEAFVEALKDAVQDVVNYRLTSASWPALKDALLSQVEEDILEKLDELKGISYDSKTGFIAAVREKIGDDYATLYESQILEAAKIEGSTGYKLTDDSFPELREKLSATFQSDILDKLTGRTGMLYTDAAEFLNEVKGDIGVTLTDLYENPIKTAAEEKGLTDHVRAMIVRDLPDRIITNQYMYELNARSIPTETLNQLKTLKDQEYDSETSFYSALHDLNIDSSTIFQIIEQAAVHIHECGPFVNLDDLVIGVSQDDHNNFQGRLVQATGTDPVHFWDWVEDWSYLYDPYKTSDYEGAGEILNGRIRQGRVTFKIKDSPAIPPVSGNNSFTSSGAVFQGVMTGEDKVQGIFYGNGSLPLSDGGDGNVAWGGFFLITPASTTVSPLLGPGWTEEAGLVIPPFIKTLDKIKKFMEKGPLNLISKKSGSDNENPVSRCKIETSDVTTGYAVGTKEAWCDDGSTVTDLKIVGTLTLKPLIGYSCSYPVFGIPYLAELHLKGSVNLWLELRFEDESHQCNPDEDTIRGPYKLILTVPIEAGGGFTLLVVMDMDLLFYFNTVAEAQVKYDFGTASEEAGFCDARANFSGTGGVKGVAKFVFWTDVLFDIPFGTVDFGGFDLSDPCS